MNRYSALRLATVISAVALIATACTTTTTPTPGPSGAPAADNGSVLVVVTAIGGAYVDQGGSGRLTLLGVHPEMTWFDDRPARLAGHMPVQAALDAMYNDGTPDPPNAALSIVGAESDQIAVVELTDPAYDPNSASLAFSAKLLDQPKFGLEFLSGRPNDAIPASFGEVSLFIDNIFSNNYCGGVVNNNSSQALTLQGFPDLNGYWNQSNYVPQSAPQTIPAGQSASFEAIGPWPGDTCTMNLSYTTSSGAGFGLDVVSPASGDNSATVEPIGSGCTATVELNSTSGSTSTGTVTFTCP